jgi:hypothetical protein
MSRFISVRIIGQLFVAGALLASWEGVSQARTTAEPLRGTIGASAGALSDAAADQRNLADRSVAFDELVRVRICHISRHPRDGIPAAEHACPLVIADASGVVAPVPSATRTN